MLSITPMMSEMRRLASWMPPMVATTSPTALPPRSATSPAEWASWCAWRAASADWRTVAVSSSMLCAVPARLLAADSVRPDRSWLPLAISALAVVMLSTAMRTCCSTCR